MPINDPDAQRKSTTPSSTTPWQSPGQTAGGSMAGWGVDQKQTIAQYNVWLNGLKANAIDNALLAAYGADYQAFAWWAHRTNQDPNDTFNMMATLFPGYEDVMSKAGGGGGSRSYGGGGGGVSKAQQFAAAEAAIRNQAATLGLPMDDASIKALARTVVNDNWSGDQLTDHLLLDPTKMNNEGSFATTASQIKTMAANQLVHINDDTAKGWARSILSGEMDITTVSTILMQQALGEFGWASDTLKAGATMRDVLSPTRDTIARELELNPDQIDMMDTKWRGMMQVANEDGTKRAATLTEAVRAARKDAKYANTAGAARTAAEAATLLRNVFEG